jgi:hypothetical protein
MPITREHFIPIRRNELVRLLCDQLPADEAASFRRYCELLADRIHLEFYRLLVKLKEDYAPFDPDSDTKPLRPVEGSERAKREEGLFRAFDRLLLKANYRRLTDSELMACQEGSSFWGVDMSVDLTAFERFVMYVRGRSSGTRMLRSWRTYFRKRPITVDIYQRLVLILKQRPHKRLGPDPDVRSVFLKLFKDIPTMDLEMLVPGAKLQMPKVERGKLGFSIVSGLVLLSWQLLKPFFVLAKAAASGAVAYGPLGIIAALFGYGYRQYYGYQFSLRTYNLKLAQSLYYQNLDNNAGVLYHLLDSAEEQESREAILAYFYLWRDATDRGMTAAELDELIERELEATANVKVDFEIDDALRKLELIGVAIIQDDRFRVCPIEEALAKLEALPAEPVFAREVFHEPRTMDFASSTIDRVVGDSPGVRAGSEPESAH